MTDGDLTCAQAAPARLSREEVNDCLLHCLADEARLVQTMQEATESVRAAGAWQAPVRHAALPS